MHLDQRTPYRIPVKPEMEVTHCGSILEGVVCGPWPTNPLTHRLIHSVY